MISFQYFIYIALILWIYWLWTRRKFYALIFKIPGCLGYPFLGVGLQCMHRKTLLNFVNQNGEKYGSMFLTWLGTYPTVVISEPDIVKDILTSSYCIKKGQTYDAFNKGLVRGLVVLDDPKWSVHRKHLNPAFKNNVLLDYIPMFNDELNEFFKTFESDVSKTDSMDLMKVLEDFLLSASIRTTFGESSGERYDEFKRKVIENIYCVKESIGDMLFSPWLKNDLLRKLLGIYEPLQRAKAVIRQLGREVIEEKMTKYKCNLDGTKSTFLDFAIDLVRRGIFSLDTVEDESYTMLGAAAETTAGSIVHALIMLAMFPKYQQKLFEELISIFPETGDFEVSSDNLHDMVYMDMVIKETMRLVTPTPIIARENTHEVQLSNGVILPAGMQIALNLFHMHRRVDIWGPKAHIFNPDNFLPSNMDGKHPYAFLPFSKGLRNCIGWRYGMMLTKVTLARLLRNYQFTTDFRYEGLSFFQEITVKLNEMPVLNISKRIE